MVRRLFTLASAVSLLLCVAAVALWVRSMWVEDKVDLTFEKTWVTVVSLRGRIEMQTFLADRSVWTRSWDWRRQPSEGLRFADTIGWELGGFEVTAPNTVTFTNYYTASHRIFFIPHWFVIGLFAALPVSALRSTRRRSLKNHCPTCHYNLTGNASGICPECGTPSTMRDESTAPTGLY